MTPTPIRLQASICRILVLSLTLTLSAILPTSVTAQKSTGGTPPGYIKQPDDHLVPTLQIAAPEIVDLLKEDEEAGKWGMPERVGVLLPVNITPFNHGSWSELPDGKRQWRLRIGSDNANHLALYFDDFHLPQGCELFVYNDSRSKLIGAFTQINNHESGLFATELIPGESLIIELIVSHQAFKQVKFSITDVLYAYRKQNAELKQFGRSGACNVNVNCSEGFGWQNEKRGVVKINSRVGSSVFRCSGSLINNTRFDFQPYLFTADHCSRSGSTYATEADLNQWIFYFNYEADDCPKPDTEPAAVSLTGAALKANVEGGNANMGSDFCLVLLNNDVPPSVIPYFNGWSRVDSPSPSGVGIHHPSGDIKKISTYTAPLVSSSWNSNTPNMYWQVRWNETQNGHGITEGGSSGSPLFNNEGFIVGQLTGGQASCTNLNAPDYYGKFAYSWESNGTTPNRQLKPWLDPDNTGVTTLKGSFNTFQVVSFFLADTTAIQVGGNVGFRDISIGEPTEWQWIFKGGEPSEVYGRDPGKITYKSYGKFDVTLIVKNESSTDTLVRPKYIEVLPGLFPNPPDPDVYHVTLLLGYHEYETLRVEVTDLFGKPITTWNYNIRNLYSIEMNTTGLRSGVYILSQYSDDGRVSRQRLIIRR